MENPRPEKVAVVEEVRSRLSSSSAAILTEYRGLKVGDLAGLRKALRDAGGEYKIYKNTLVRFAARDLGLAELEELLIGPTAIAFVDGDAAAVAKALRDFSRTHPALVVKGGVLGERVLSDREAGALADLPSRDVLLSQLAGLMAAPLQQFAGLLQALPQNLAYAIQALADKGGAPGAPADAPAEAPAGEPAAAEASATEPPLTESPAPDATAVPPAEPEAAAPTEAPAAEPLAESPAPDATAAPPADPTETDTDTESTQE